MSEAQAFNKLREDQAILFSHFEDSKLVAKHAMIKPVFLKESDDSQTILNKLKKSSVNSCLVITKNKEYLGEISDSDILKLFQKEVKSEPLTKYLNIGYKKEFIHQKAKELINKHKYFVYDTTPINEVIELMNVKKLQDLPVLNKNHKVVGLINTSSLIKLLDKR